MKNNIFLEIKVPSILQAFILVIIKFFTKQNIQNLIYVIRFFESEKKKKEVTKILNVRNFFNPKINE